MAADVDVPPPPLAAPDTAIPVERLPLPTKHQAEEALDEQRWEILHRFERWLDIPMVVLGFVWLALIVVDLVRGLSPFLRGVSDLIWVLFGVEFALSFFLAPKKLAFLRTNWL